MKRKANRKKRGSRATASAARVTQESGNARAGGRVGDAEHGALLRVRALDLRIRGYSYRKIGTALGISGKTSYRQVNKALRELATEQTTLATETRQLELERLDAMLGHIWSLVETGSLTAVEAALRVGKRRADLLGLDAPTKIAPTDQSGTKPFSGDLTKLTTDELLTLKTILEHARSQTPAEPTTKTSAAART